jgi:hypothetical protein
MLIAAVSVSIVREVGVAWVVVGLKMLKRGEEGVG